ncbi:hypothetical protein Bca4012_076015 [Brassica carinata]
MAKTRWTRRKKTKALKDISTPSKYVPEVDVEENVVQEEERSEEEEANLEENEENSGEEEERSEKEEVNLDENDVEENKENSGEEEARSEEEETNRENDPLGENVHRNDEGAREEGSTNPTLSENGGKETEATNEATWNTFKLNEVVEVINSFKEDIGGRLTRIEEKVGEIDSRLVASEGFVQELLDARNADADVEEEEDMSKRPKKK